HHHRIAEVVAITRIAEIALAHERIERERGDLGSGCLVEYADGRVDGLDEIGGTHVTVGVGRVPRTPGVEVQSRDAGQRTRRRSARCRRRLRGPYRNAPWQFDRLQRRRLT